MMRRWRNASRKDARVAAVSQRALKSRLPDLASLDHHGMSPQRKVMTVRTGSPPSFCGRSRTPRTWSVGATFQLGSCSASSPSANVASK